MNLEFLLAKRYLWSKRRHPFVGVVSTISVVGIAVGVAALMTVLAVMNGFDADLKERIIGTRAHLVVEHLAGMDRYEPVQKQIQAMGGVRGVTPYIEGQALLKKEEWATGVLVRGMDPKQEKNVSSFFNYVAQGHWSGSEGEAVVGAELAKRYGFLVGDSIELLTQSTDKPVPMRIRAIFSCGIYDYDANVIFVNLSDAQKLFEMGSLVSGLSVYLKNERSANEMKRPIREKIGHGYSVRSWMDLNKTLFGALELEKNVMFLILALIIFVACLNIAGSLTILVMDKTKDIGVYRALGMQTHSVMMIFAWDGMLVGLLGATFGTLLGLLMCWVLGNFSIVSLPKEIYYFEHLPVRLSLWDSSMIFCVTIFLSFLSTVYPAWMAGRLEPCRALRYE